MSRFTNVTFETAAADHHALSEIFARNLQLDELYTTARSEEEFFLMKEVDHHPPAVNVQTTGVQLSPHTGDNNRGDCCYQKNNTQLQVEANNNDALGLSAVHVDKTTIQHVIPIKNPHAILRRPKARPRIIKRSSYFLPRHSAIHQQRHHKQYHRRYPKSKKFLRCHYAPWAQATTNFSSGMCALLQHLAPPPLLPPVPYPHRHSPRFTNTMTPFGLGKKRSRTDWSSMNDNMESEASGLDTILEDEEVDNF